MKCSHHEAYACKSRNVRVNPEKQRLSLTWKTENPLKRRNLLSSCFLENCSSVLCSIEVGNLSKERVESGFADEFWKKENGLIRQFRSSKKRVWTIELIILRLIRDWKQISKWGPIQFPILFLNLDLGPRSLLITGRTIERKQKNVKFRSNGNVAQSMNFTQHYASSKPKEMNAQIIN